MSVRVLGWVALVAAGAVLAVPWLPDEWQVWSIRGQEKAVLVRDVVGQEATATPPARSRELSGDGATAAGPPQEQNADPGPGPALALDNPRSSAAPESNGPAGAAPGATSESESPPRQSASPFPLEELREYMLDLINEDRQAHDLSPVALGYNPAAQAHAEEMLEHSYLSHWGMDGLKPYMRYTLAGGINYEAENVSGIAAPLQEGVRFREQSPFASMRESQAGFMNSPGHRANVLNEWHQKVNLGIACNLYTCTVVQQFQGDYLAFSWVPSLDSGRLTMEGILAEPFTASSVQVWYDQPPHPLALGQLDTTHSYRLGQQPAAFLRKPPPTGS